MSARRLGWLDLSRAVAICAVVTVHACEACYSYNLDAVAKLSGAGRLLLFSAFGVGRLGVPLFLMTSGWLLLERDYSGEGAMGFLRRSWLPLLAVTEGWNVGYLVFLHLLGQIHYSPMDVILRLLFLKGSPMSHLWYMPMILGWYLTVPFLAQGLRSTDLQAVKLAVGLLCCYGFAAPVANIWFMSNTEAGLSTFVMPGFFEGGFYGLYLLLGWLVRRGVFRRVPGWLLALGIPAGLAVSVALMCYSYDHAYLYNIRYNLGTLALSGLCLFELLSRLEEQPLPWPVLALGRFAFPVYLTHNVFRVLAQSALRRIDRLPLRLAAAWCLIMGLGLLSAWAISKIPRIGRRVLYLK